MKKGPSPSIEVTDLFPCIHSVDHHIHGPAFLIIAWDTHPMYDEGEH